MKTRVGVIFGGRSGEHDISIRSATSMMESIDRSKYTLIPIAIDQTGRWLSPKTSLALLPESLRNEISSELSEFSSDSIALIGDPKYRGLKDLEPGSGADSVLRLDVIFPVLHGPFGEDGTIQGLLAMADIPYVGSGVLGSSCGMDKVVMKSLFKQAGLPICKYVWLLRSEWRTKRNELIGNIEDNLGYPCFVKPANLGSSVGVSRAEDRDELITAIELAAEFDRKVIVEEALQMREIECGIIGNESAEASLPGEYIIRDRSKTFLDFTEKYQGTGNNEFIVPAPISDELSFKIRSLAIQAFHAIDGAGLARVDFFLRTDNSSLLVNEINTMPGLTDASGYPKMWAGSGKDFTTVIDELISLAVERHSDRSKNRVSRQA